MIEINLLPEELKKGKELDKKIGISKFNLSDIKEVPISKLCAAFFTVVLLVQLLLLFMGIYCKAVLGTLKARYEAITPKRKEAGALKSEVEKMNKKMKAIDELMVKRFSWTKKLGDLSDSLTPGIWLTELSYDEKTVEKQTPAASSRQKNLMGEPRQITVKTLSKYLIISGYASSMGEEGTASIGRFIKSLRENPAFYSDFSDIELGSIKRDRIDDQEVMNFKIICLFKELK